MFDVPYARVIGGRARIGGKNFNRFGGIDGATAAEGDQIVALRVAPGRKAALHQRFGGVREDLVKKFVRHLLRIERGKEAIKQAEFDQLSVGDDQRLAPVFIRYQFHHVFDSARAVQADFG